MAKPIIKKVRAMRWQAWVNLMLAFTLIFSVFMLHGLYAPYEAQAAPPAIRAVGAVAANAAAVTPGMPAGVLQNDILLLFIETADQAITVSGGTETWTEVTGSPVIGATGTRLTVFWARASQDSPTSPITSDSGDHQLTRIIAFSGVITSGNPWDVAGTNIENTSDTSVSISGVTTTVADTLIVLAMAGDLPDGNGTADFSAWTNGGLTNLTEQIDNTSNAGGGGALGVATGEKASAGATGATTATLANAAVKAMMTIALKPAPPDITPPTTSGLTFDSPVSGTYIGSPFTFHGDLTDNESNVTACQYCVKNGSECISTDTWVAGTLSGSSPLWTCTASNVSTYTNAGAITSGDAVYIDVRGTSTGGQNANGGTAITKTMDKLGPNSGASFTATPGNTTCTLNWASTTDAGVGMHSTEPYEVRWQLGSDPGSCSGGAQLYIGTALTTPHNSLTNGSTYYYRLCYKDAFLYQSGYSGNPITCVPVSGPPTLNPDSITAGTWTNEAGGALTPDKINDASDLTYAKTSTNGATFDASFSNDAAYSGKQIDNVRIYVRAYAAGEKIDWGPVIGGTPYLSGTQVTLTTTPTDYFKDWATNPQSGVNWTPAEVDALVARMSAIATGGMSEERVYKVWAVITYSEPVVSAINHNSTSTSSSKWPGNGGWGLAGTKYGEFICATCHEPRATNIKSIKSTITAPVGSFPGPGTVNFQSTTSPNGFGNDFINDGTKTPRASSTKVCEVCHTYDASGGSGVTAHPYSTGATLGNHQNGDNTDCTSCHKHNKGFDAACDVCHGNPPGVLAFDPGPTGSTTAGKHNTHVTTLSFVCTNCHFGYSASMPETPQIIDIGFSMFTKDGTGTSYTGHTETDGYRGRNGTSVASIDTNRTCNNLYCHGAFSGGLTASPTWIGTAACGTCHANTAASAASLRASHTRHAGNGAGGISVACADCHNNGTVYTTVNGHVNGSVAWSLKTSDNRFGTNAKYNAAASGATGAVAPSGTYQTCGTLYCHSNVQSGTALAGPTTYGTPTWGAASVTCAEGATGCHGNSPATPTANNAHGTHTTGNYSFTCAACHSSAGDETTLHANGTINMTIAATYGGTYSQGDHAPGAGGYGTCSNIYCHGNFTGGLNASPAWNASIDCTTATCHNYTNATPPTKVNHPRHSGTGAGQLNLACTSCHPARASLDGHVDLSVQWDLDRTDAKFGATASYNALELGSTGAKAPSASYANCTNVYCHSSVQSNPGTGAPTYAAVTWGAASVTCDSCHGQGAHTNGQPSTGSHEVHVTTYSYTCAICHSGHGEDISTHANGTINLAFDSTTAGASATYSRGTSITPQSGTFSTCTTTKCHGDSTNTSADTGNWGTSLSGSDACTVCHGTKQTATADGAATAYLRAPGGNATGVDTSGATGTFTRNVSNDQQVGAHDGHLRGVANISNAIACTECHAVPVVSVTGIKGHLDGTPANITWGTLATTGSAPASYVPATFTCNTTYCHNPEPYTGTANHTNGGTGLSPVWNNQTYFGDNIPPLTSTECNRCHFYDATNCSSCHYVTTAGDFVNADNLSFAAANKGLHINGTVTAVAGDCSSCHGRTTAGGGDLDNFAGDATKAMVNTDEWAALGHGRPTASGNYPGTNPNPPANFDGLAGAGQDACLWCHDKASADHGNYTTNPYRLIHMNEATLTNHPNDACLWCHDTNQTTASYKAVATFTTGINLANVQKIDKWHYGTQHGASLAGGRFCWDCHDPHGDGTTGPIKMIQKYPTKNNTGATYGVPSGANDIDEAVAIVFTNNNLGTGANGFAMTAGTFRQGICNACHTYKAADPNKMDNYYSTGYDGAHSTSVCTTCHKHSKDSTNNGLAFEGDGTCTGCHINTQGTRRAVVGEFGLAFGHHNNTVTNADCVVCHMEGTSVADPTRSAAHAGVPGGNVDLRDPDLGTAIANPAAIFARNLSSNTLEAFALSIQNNHCLKCHDSNGANYLGAGQTGTDGSHTPSNPFVTGVAPVNVDTQFATGNTSFHPVKGVQNNANCDFDTMVAPWDVPNGTHKPITCFDCHAAQDATGTQSSTVVAHGNAVTLRKSITAATGTANPLCVECHKATIYWGANVHSGTGSGWSGNTEARHQPGDHYGCTSCHGVDNYASAAGTQTTRAEAAHGFNTAGEYAFLRGSSGSKFTWDSTNPRTTCDGMNCGTGRSDGPFSYTPGGTY